MKINSDTCKAVLTMMTGVSDWKRRSKTKDGDGAVVRVFDSAKYSAVITERNGVLTQILIAATVVIIGANGAVAAMNAVSTVPRISTDALKSKIETSFISKYIDHYSELAIPTDRVARDVSHIEFDMENVSCPYGMDYEKDPPTWKYDKGYIDFGPDEIVGFHTTPKGLAFMGVCAGGDWEVPIVYIIYWDGKELRGYIPTKGNPYNVEAKSAYGNNEDSDLDRHQVPDYAVGSIIQDIDDNIKVEAI